MKSALQVKNLVKSYSGKEVLHGISFEVKEGEIFALLGSNGAGKTTTLECVEGLRKYEKGEIIFLDKKWENGSIHKLIGIQLQSTALPNNITAIEAYKLFCKANKVKCDETILERFGLDKLKNKQYLSMSTGQKRRLHLVLSLLHNPKIVFLDEPTAGLDVEGQVALHNELLRLKGQGTTIILTSHNMAEVEKLCDRIAILRDGQIGFIGSPKDLISSYEDKTEIAIKSRIGYQKDELKYSQYIKSENDYELYHAKNISDAMLELLTKNKSRNNDILDIRINHSSLEDKFMEFSKEETA